MGERQLCPWPSALYHYRMRVAQTVMLGIRLKTEFLTLRSIDITRCCNVRIRVIELKWRLAWHLVRQRDGRWSKTITEWWPRTGKNNMWCIQPQGRSNIFRGLCTDREFLLHRTENCGGNEKRPVPS